MSKSSSKREKEQKEVVSNEEYACPVCGRMSVDEAGCPAHKEE